VLSDASGDPVADATILIDGVTRLTDLRGSCTASGLGSGDFPFIISADGFEKAEGKAFFSSISGDTDYLTIRLLPAEIFIEETPIPLGVAEREYTLAVSEIPQTWIVCKLHASSFSDDAVAADFLVEGAPEGLFVDDIRLVDHQTVLVGLRCLLDVREPLEDLQISARSTAFPSENAGDGQTALGRIRIIPDPSISQRSASPDASEPPPPTLVTPTPAEKPDMAEGTIGQADDAIALADDPTPEGVSERQFILFAEELSRTWIVLRIQDAVLGPTLLLADFVLENAPEFLSIEAVRRVDDHTVYVCLHSTAPILSPLEGVHLLARPGVFAQPLTRELRAIGELLILPQKE
jgi:hypothetical protein